VVVEMQGAILALCSLPGQAAVSDGTWIFLMSTPSTTATAPATCLARAAPALALAWRGRWPTGTVEPWRLLYDHELIIFEQGDCLVTIADAPPRDPGPIHHDAQGRPRWQAVSGAAAAALATPAPGTTHACGPGTFLIIPPDTPHLTVVASGPSTRACIHFDWLAGDAPPAPVCTVPPERPDPALLRRAPGWAPQGVVFGNVRARRAVDDLIHTFFRRWNTRRHDERLACRGTMLELLVRLLGDADTEAASSNELAQAVKDRLERHLADPRSLPELLTDLDRSYEHCCRVFTATFGVPPLRYLTAARIEQAKHLLRQGDVAIATVARAVGYADAAYFSRVFTAQVGLGPRRFRGR
jgi:AraC-like DNA-binding protein